MDQRTNAELLDEIEGLRERLRISELRAAERDAIAAERDAMKAERDAAVLAACRVLMMADGYAMMKEREMMRHVTCSAQHRMFSFV